jgi:endonuclease/exonuclease/phosphatase (EEP) superfamily protein YafD
MWGGLRAADVSAPATVAMFGPLPLLALPPLVLLGAAAVVRRRAAWTLVPACYLVIGPVSGFCVPWDRLAAGRPAGLRTRALTCNMHYTRHPTAPLDLLIEQTSPDIVALQEWRQGDSPDAFAGGGWHVHREPGLFLASRHPIRRAERLGHTSTGAEGSVARYELDLPEGVVTLFSVHLASPRDGLREAAEGDVRLAGLAANSERRWAQSRHLAAMAERTVGPLLLVGDFNTPPQSAITRRVWAGYEDAFSTAGWGWGHTFAGSVSAVRIDHILVGGGGRATKCWVGPDVGSPHRPVLAEVVWPAAVLR